MWQGNELELVYTLCFFLPCNNSDREEEGRGDGFTRQDLHLIRISNELLGSPRPHGWDFSSLLQHNLVKNCLSLYDRP